MHLSTDVFPAFDGVELFVRSYSPSQPDPARVVYWVHGLGEHGGRHEHLAAFFVSRGWRMIVPDLRGHGRSGGVATYVKSFETYVDDIVTIWNRLDLYTVPPVLLGHSMGGLIATRAVQTGHVAPSALVLSSPLLGLKLRVNPIVKWAGKMLLPIIPTVRFHNGIDPANLTRDSQFAEARRRDPLIDKTVTAGWFFAMQAALKGAQRDAAKIRLPVLALQGDCDRTTDPAALADWWDRIQSSEKKRIVLADHIHELFFEADWSDTASLVVDWLEERIKASFPSPVDENSG